MPIPEMSVEEITSAVRRSRLFNVIVEGRDDIIAFRIMERRIRESGSGSVYLMSAGGRNKLLQIYDRLRGEDVIRRCAFICDRDLWVFSGVPEEYSSADIIKTDGYSIENDLLRDYPPQNLMDMSERGLFAEDVCYFSKWYSLEVSKALQGLEASLKIFPGRVLDEARRDFDAELDADHQAQKICARVQTNVDKFLRGKSLMQVALRQLDKPGRAARHTARSFLEHAANSNGLNFSRISQAVSEKVIESQVGD